MDAGLYGEDKLAGVDENEHNIVCNSLDGKEENFTVHSSLETMEDVKAEQFGLNVAMQRNDLRMAETVLDQDTNSSKNVEDARGASSNEMQFNELGDNNNPAEGNDMNALTDLSNHCIEYHASNPTLNSAEKGITENESNFQMEDINKEVKMAKAEEGFYTSSTNDVDLVGNEKPLNEMSGISSSCYFPVDNKDCGANIPQNCNENDEKNDTIDSNLPCSTSAAKNNPHVTTPEATNKCQASRRDAKFGADNQKCLKSNSMGLNLLANYLSCSESEDECMESNTANLNSTSLNNPSKDSLSTNAECYRDQSSIHDSDISNSSDSLNKSHVSNMVMTNQDESSDSESTDDLAESESEEEREETKPYKKTSRRVIKAEGELTLEDLPPIENLHITVAEDECVEFGKVDKIVQQLVLVKALPNSMFLDIESVLFLEKGKKVLGAIFDVLGQVSSPLYCVRFNSAEHIQESNIQIGDVVYAAPKTQYSQFLILSNLMKMRGSDASWVNDLEPPPECLDYSDDEAERLAKQNLRNKNKGMECDDDPPTKQKTKAAKSNKFKQTASNRHAANYPAYASTSSYNPNQRFPAGSQCRHSSSVSGYHHSAQNNMNSWHSNFPNPFWNRFPRQIAPHDYNYYRASSARVPIHQAVTPPPRLPYISGQYSGHPQFVRHGLYSTHPPPPPPAQPSSQLNEEH